MAMWLVMRGMLALSVLAAILSPPGVSADWEAAAFQENACVSESMCTPEQIRLAWGNDLTEMRVAWATPGWGSSEVVFGLFGSSLNQTATGECLHFTYGNPDGVQWVHHVKLQGLELDQDYQYYVMTNGTKSDVFSFSTPHRYRGDGDHTPNLLIFGDMGHDSGAPTLARLINEVDRGTADAAVHLGDFAYDLHDDGGVKGDEFMRRIQPIAARIPYMTTVGNHEDYFNYSQYINRFYMPHWEETQNMWFSFNVANIHFISLSTEVYYYDHEQYSPEAQLEWLEQDLIEASQNREAQPWIIALMHRPFYCSNMDRDDCTGPTNPVRLGFEEMFMKYGVDLSLEAHEHSYEALWPTYDQKATQYDYINPKAPVHVVNGAAGCNETGGLCLNPILGSYGDWSRKRFWLMTYGYMRLTAVNSTHLYYEQVWDMNGEVLDSVWIEQQNHGPFSG